MGGVVDSFEVCCVLLKCWQIFALPEAPKC